MKLSLLILLLAVNGFAWQVLKADQIRLKLEHDGISRMSELYIPASYDNDIPTPLLIALHGRSSNSQRMADLTSFNIRAEAHGFMVAYPQGAQNQWNYLHGIAGRSQPNDSEFLLKIIEVVSRQYNIDSNRIYVTGISNGGFMAQRLACYAPHKFAAFASVAAGGYASMPVDCDKNTPVNMLYMHGTADQKVPWEGLGIIDGNGNRQLVTMSISSSIKFWASRNQCGPKVARKDIPAKGNSPGTQVNVFSSNECSGNAEVILYAIIGGGHNWPGVADFIPASIAGRVNLDVHASDVIWLFFKNKRINR